MPNGPRIRANNVYGIISDNPLTPASTTFNSVSLPLLPVVAAAHAVIVFDPKRVFGDPEIVVVTVHTASSTVATILRGQYGTSAREHPQGTVWSHVPVDEDWIEILTSSTRPSDPYRGQTIFEIDTNRYVSRSTADVWQQNGLFFDPPACRVFPSAAQNANDLAFTTLAFDSEDYDTNNMHDNAINNSRITINTAGIYNVVGVVNVSPRADWRSVILDIFLNGTTSLSRQKNLININASGTLNENINLVVSVQYLFSVGNFIELRFYQDNTANAVASVAQGPITAFSATWIGRGN